jgi:undecaprenyl-diphosphatase
MFDYFILGIIQGIVEWIPISSQGVVSLVSQLIIKDFNPLEVALFLHSGTLLAAVIYFRKDWFDILKLKDKILLRFLIISTIVSALIGFIFYHLIKDLAVGSGLLIVTGFGLIFTAYFHKTKKTIEINFNCLAIVAGFLQGLAVIPGFSRSGGTIFGLSLFGLPPEKILKISYLMSIPAVLLMTGFLLVENPVLIVNAWPSLISSLIIGLISLNFLIKLGSKINFFKFALIFSLLCFLGAGLTMLV